MSNELYCHWISTKCTMVQLLSRHTGGEVAVRNICVFPTEENISDRHQANLNVRKMERMNFFSGISGIRIPILVIDDQKIKTDIKEILKYLMEKYCEDDLLYPNNNREEVDVSFCFAIDTLDELVADAYYYDIVRKKPQALDKVEKVNEALEKVEEFIGENDLICGVDLTIADFCLAVITSILEAVNHDMSNFPKTTKHLNKSKELILGWDEVAKVGASRYAQWYRAASEAAEHGGCPYFPKLHNTVNEPVTCSSDIELFSYSLFPKTITIELLARTLELDLVIKKTDLCHKEENVESRKEADENWGVMLNHLYFSDNEEADVPPMLVDKGNVVVETGNVLKYMVEMHGSDEICQKLYPSDSATRNLVESVLSSDLDILDPLVLETYVYSFKNAVTKREIDPEKVSAIKDNLQELEENLQQNDFVAGNNLTIADFAIAVTLSVLATVDSNIVSEFERISLYLKNCKGAIKDWEDVGEPALNLLGEWYKDCVDWTENGNCPYYSG